MQLSWAEQDHMRIALCPRQDSIEETEFTMRQVSDQPKPSYADPVK